MTPACKQALEKGDEEAKEWLDACPVFETDQGRNWSPLDWKKLKDLKQAAESYGIDSPFVKEMLASLANSTILTPNDWKTLAKVVKKAGWEVDLKTATAFVDTILKCCPWIQYNGLDLCKWEVVGYQITSCSTTKRGRVAKQEIITKTEIINEVG